MFSRILLVCLLLEAVCSLPTGQQASSQREKAKKALVKEGGPSEQDLDQVHALLAKLRARARKDLDALAKKQDADEAFKAKVKRDEENRKTHPSKETKHADDISEMNADINEYLFQGDIVLTPAQAEEILAAYGPDETEDDADVDGKLVQKRQAINPVYFTDTHPTRSRWPNGVVYYTFDSVIGADAGLKALILKAMALWSSKTCIVFVESATAGDKLIFTRPADPNLCNSNFGRVASYSAQSVNLGTNCEHIGVIAHEIAHALGFYHEQSRHDRDQWVTYMASNVQSGGETQFVKETTTTNDNYGQTYDYGSVMHYRANAFSSNGNPTLYTELAWPSSEWQQTPGQHMGPSMTDLKVMNELYSCASRCATPITCYNGGYQNPKNCAACVCPAGIGGNLCEFVNPVPIRYGYAPAGVPNTCTGTALQATSTWAELVGSIGSATFNTQYDSDYAWCHWFINADTTNRIEIEVLEVGDVCVVGCHYGNLEVRVWEGADWGKTGRRMCCAADL